jgi:hypothetical protein
LPWGRPSTLEPVTEQEQRQWAFAWPEPPDHIKRVLTFQELAAQPAA